MFDYIYIAANNSSKELKAKSDFVCTGTNDELTIQKAIETCVKDNKNIYLLNGIYNIGGFYDFNDDGPMSSICIPNAHREIKFIGQNHEYGFQKSFDNGVVFLNYLINFTHFRVNITLNLIGRCIEHYQIRIC